MCTNLGSLIGKWKYAGFFCQSGFSEISFGHIGAQKTAILTIWAAINFEFLEIFDIYNRECFPKLPKIKTQGF